MSRRARTREGTAPGFVFFVVVFYFMFVFNIIPQARLGSASQHNLQATTTATALLTGGVGGHGGHVLDAANLEAGAGEGAEGRLATGAGALRLVATRRAHLDVKSGEPELLREKRERERT